MGIRLYDTRAARLRDFVPLVDGRVGIYVCGPTVQSSPHIGHLRSALVYDQMRRWFNYRGYDVTLVRNVTDIDDKVLVNAAQAQASGSPEQWWALAYRSEREFTDAYAALGIQPPTPDLGTMVASGASFLPDDWWESVLPGAAILFVALGFNLLGDGLRDLFDVQEVR